MRRDARQHAVAAAQPIKDALSPESFKREVTIWSERLEVSPKEVHVTPMTRKWASCSPKGRVTFASDLLAQPEGVRREVIVHELLHLKVPNHGALFRALLATYLSGTTPVPSASGGCDQGPDMPQQSAQRKSPSST